MEDPIPRTIDEFELFLMALKNPLALSRAETAAIRKADLALGVFHRAMRDFTSRPGRAVATA